MSNFLVSKHQQVQLRHLIDQDQQVRSTELVIHAISCFGEVYHLVIDFDFFSECSQGKMNYHCVGTVMRRADGNIAQTSCQIPKATGNSVDKYRQQIVDQQLVIQQQELQIETQRQQQQQKAVPHYSTPLNEGLLSERKGDLAADQISRNLSIGASVDRSCGYNISGGDRSSSDNVNNNADDNNKMYKLRYGSSTTKAAPTVAIISNSPNISKYQPFYASVIPPNFLDNPSQKITKTPR
jgi:hypothetical protein